MEYMILDYEGQLIARKNFHRVIPDVVQPAFNTSEAMINEAKMNKEDVLKWKEVKQQYGWNYRVFEFKERKFYNMQILAKFE
jgi:hypothetical protein